MTKSMSTLAVLSVSNFSSAVNWNLVVSGCACVCMLNIEYSISQFFKATLEGRDYGKCEDICSSENFYLDISPLHHDDISTWVESAEIEVWDTLALIKGKKSKHIRYISSKYPQLGNHFCWSRRGPDQTCRHVAHWSTKEYRIPDV